MQRSENVTVRVDLGRVRANVEAIKARTKVDTYAVVKADGYGFGAARVAAAVADLVRGYYCFTLTEAVDAGLKRFGKVTLAMVPPQGLGTAEDYLAQGARPGVGTVGHARAYARARPVISVDTGMQRFAVGPGEVDAAIAAAAGGCDEAMTHGTRVDHAVQLKQLLGNRGMRLHAAGTALLDEPAAWLDAVRPGLAMYRGCARVTARLAEARETRGPAGYTGFVVPRHGVILCGYSHGLRTGPCVVNGRRTRIVEVGMQSAFVELEAGDKVGDEVVLLGDDLSEAEVAEAWGVGAHVVCVRMGGMGVRGYVGT